MIFGILNIGFGVLGLGNLLMRNTFESFASQASNPALNSMMALMDAIHKSPTYMVWRDISVPLEGVASLALLAAGIGLLRLKNWARLASVVYAIYTIIFVFANLLVLGMVLGETLRQTLQNLPGVLLVVVAGAMLVGVVLSLAYPALLIYFMTRPKIRAAFALPAPPTLSPQSNQP
jgi:hypothetical protein